MTTRYHTPSVESILEDSEDGSSAELRTKGGSADENYRQSRSSRGSAMKANTGKEREKERERERERDRPRRHKSSKHTSKGKLKNIGVKRASGALREEYEEPRLRHRHERTNRSSSSTSSSGAEDLGGHMAVLAARSRLTSPSMVSTITTQTTATNKSSSSSGSNSTVTQASVTKRSSLGKRPEVEEAKQPPMSAAVSDPPNVFQFLDREGSPDSEGEATDGEGEKGHDENDGKDVVGSKDEESEETDQEQGPQWSSSRMKSAYIETPSPPLPNQNASESSSVSSSFHGDDHGSEPPADVDTDRSSSPERSIHEHDEPGEVPEPPPTDQASAKIASQIAAAQERQNAHGVVFGTPNMPRGNTQLPHIASSAMTSRYQHQMQQRPFPQAQKLPVTGYELLASRLSASPGRDNRKGARIKPMYRKFEALNHRLLLHLQDELSELEEQLHRLDQADTESRRTDRHGYIIPASRRLAAQAGGELQWHKTDVLGKIGFKLNQYNQALSSFNSTQSLHQPEPEDIEQYRTYLQTEQPIVEAETHFLDPTDDLVSIYPRTTASPSPSPSSSPSSSLLLSSPAPSSTVSSSDSELSSRVSSSTTASAPISLHPSHPELQPIVPGLASGIAIAILVPILTFSVIPGFVGRLTVAMLVAVFMVGAMIQSGIVQRNALLGKESLTCAGIYVGAMVVLAGIVA